MFKFISNDTPISGVVLERENNEEIGINKYFKVRNQNRYKCMNIETINIDDIIYAPDPERFLKQTVKVYAGTTKFYVREELKGIITD